MRPVVMALVAGILTLACQPRPADDPAPAGPVITRLAPDRGPAGVAYPLRIRVEGRGFMAGGNTVRFGDLLVPRLESESTDSIVFYAPKERPATGEVPPMPLLPGEYAITIETPSGMSQPAVFTLTQGP